MTRPFLPRCEGPARAGRPFSPGQFRAPRLPAAWGNVFGRSLDGLARRDPLARALRQLPRDQQEAIVLRYSADLTVEEIAHRTTHRPGTVKSRLHRGLATILLQVTADEARDGRPDASGGTPRASRRHDLVPDQEERTP